MFYSKYYFSWHTSLTKENERPVMDRQFTDQGFLVVLAGLCGSTRVSGEKCAWSILQK
jgi:hypothetical protein